MKQTLVKITGLSLSLSLEFLCYGRAKRLNVNYENYGELIIRLHLNKLIKQTYFTNDNKEASVFEKLSVTNYS